MSEWIDCSKCGTNHENLCACPEPFIKQPREEYNMTHQESFKYLIKDIHQNAIYHGFWDSQNIGEKLMLVNTELAEFFERYRRDDFSSDEHCPEFSNQTIELADTIIRILDLCGWLGVHNLGDALIAKMEFNKTRPHKHGKCF